MEPPAESSATQLKVVRLGLRRYTEVWELQRQLQRALIDGHGQDTLILCEHEAVITLGRSGSMGNLLCPPAELERHGIEFYEIERGGDITFHGPGQLVAYPIIDLRRKKPDVDWYMRSLEEVGLRTLKFYNIAAERISGRTGLWVPAQDGSKQRIASLGVRISRWCTLHGLSLNVGESKSGFDLINPCGFKNISMSSIFEVTGKSPGLEEVSSQFLLNFIDIFNCTEVREDSPCSLQLDGKA